jgi:capsular exopolysaccharide synthesis family protein
MERLKQALERARAERPADGGAAAVAPLREAPERRAIEREEAVKPPDATVRPIHPRLVPANTERLLANRIVAMAEHDPAATAYKVLRTHVLQRMRANGWKTLAITSPTQGNGKTVTAINLAITLARDLKHTVLLVDLDLRRPSMASYFFETPVPGVSDFITDDRPIEELLINPGIERLTLLPGNHSFTHSSEVLSSPRMIELVDDLKGRYPDRLVLFDMPPMLTGDDVIAFSPYVDAFLLVIEEGKTTKDQLSDAYTLLDNNKILGTVLNRAEEGSTGVGYY